MTERLSDINARIDGIRQLGAVVNAMRGIAAARAQQARGELVAVDSYAGTIAIAIGRTLPLIPTGHEPAAAPRSARPALVLFAAEQGFAGAFSERVLDAVDTESATSEVFLIGTRGHAIAAERGVRVAWHTAMPSHSSGVPKLAERISEALYARFASGAIDRLEVVFSQWQPAHGLAVERRRLFPLDLTGFPRPSHAGAPILNLAPGPLMIALDRRLRARPALQDRAACLRGGERGAHGSDDLGAQPDRAPVGHLAGRPAHRAAAGDHRGNHRTRRRRDGKPHRVSLMA